MGKGEIQSHIADGQYEVDIKYRYGVGDYSTTAWCCDYAADPYTELTGEVGTIEIPNEPQEILLRPGYPGTSAWDAVRDGRLVKAAALTPLEFFYNYAIFPGWQRWCPKYRIGVIGAATQADYDSNQLPVTIYSSVSSISLGFDVTPVISAKLPVEYMECNALAFEQGDEVVIEFTPTGDWVNVTHTAKIIGFRNNPKKCDFIETFLGPLPSSKYNWSAHFWFRFYSPPSTVTLDEDPWVSLSLEMAGSRIEFTPGGTPPGTRGKAFIYRANPSGRDTNRNSIIAKAPIDPITGAQKYWKITKNELTVVVSQYMCPISELFSIQFYREANYPNYTSMITRHFLTSVGTHVFDISAHIGEDVLYVWVSDAASFEASGSVVGGEASITIDFISFF